MNLLRIFIDPHYPALENQNFLNMTWLVTGTKELIESIIEEYDLIGKIFKNEEKKFHEYHRSNSCSLSGRKFIVNVSPALYFLQIILESEMIIYKLIIEQ